MLGAALTAATTGTAHAQDVLAPTVATPEGPATIRAYWDGPVTLEGRPPEVLVGWGVTVGPGSLAGPVRLRVLQPGQKATAKAAGPTVQLPAEPGTYNFDLPTGIPYDYRDSGLALDQEVGMHVLLATRPNVESQTHVFQPRLADDAAGVTPTSIRTSLIPAIAPRIERDIDGDLLGDTTQDTGDLRVLTARVAGRDDRQKLYKLTARVRNTGTTVRHLPGIAIPDGAYSWRCDPPLAGQFRHCGGPALQPGAEGDVTLWLGTPDDRRPTSVTVASEGPDATPEDNTISLTPKLKVAKTNGATPRVKVTSDRPGTARVTAQLAGVRISRTLTFRAAGERVVRLLPSRRADRRRLNRALRRPGRLTTTVRVTLDDGRAATRARF